MIYPVNFETKIGFDEIRTLLRQRCMSTLGKEMVDNIAMSDDCATVNEWLQQVREFRRLLQEEDNVPLQYFFDVRESVSRLRLEGTYMTEDELFDLRRSLETIMAIVALFNRSDEDSEDKTLPYPALHRLAEDVMTFPVIMQRIDQILDKFGKVKDSASAELLTIRRELAKMEGSISRTLYNILRSAQNEGLVEKDVTPTLRDGRLVIPVAPGLKRKISGIVHDESASGKTVFIEPTEVVEANNRVRELEAEEHREVVRILKEFALQVRPHVDDILYSYQFLAKVDMIKAKAELADTIGGFEPVVDDKPHIDWIQAKHPLLLMSLAKQGKKVVPLDIILTQEKRILIISGPNAGGKSVCLKTVGLLQYMLQCGIPIPIGERSATGIFRGIMIDIGDEQSIENDLSTYSSHLTNMKNMMRHANGSTLLLIDEFGGGTEPTIGGAIAEAVLKQFCGKGAFGVITTHYQNLKHFADNHEGIANGAMLYDRHEMRALFQLAIGQPGSSFAIEIARKTGIPDEVIRDASEIVGSDYIQSDKYLQDIVRDKRYWENKRQTIHQHEKSLEQKIAKYEAKVKELEQSRKEILGRAKQQAEEMLKESNKKIENTIREIRESQAERKTTKRIRQKLNAFHDKVSEVDTKVNEVDTRVSKVDTKAKDEPISKTDALAVGSTVRIEGLTTVGTIEQIDGKMATVIFGDIRTRIRLDRLERANAPKREETRTPYQSMGRQTRETIDERRLNFHQDIDVRGMRGDEAINAVTYFIDDAILVGVSRVRILHGTGNGILRQLIRQYLNTVPNVAKYHDENVQFGGAGITVVDLS